MKYTLTEAAYYYARLMIKEGRLTEEQWRKIRREGFIFALVIIGIALTPAILLLMLN